MRQGAVTKSVLSHCSRLVSFVHFCCFHPYTCLSPNQLSDVFLAVRYLLSFWERVCVQEPGCAPFHQQVVSLAVGCWRLSIHSNRFTGFMSLGITVFMLSFICFTSQTSDRETEAAFLTFYPQGANEGRELCLSVESRRLGFAFLDGNKMC